MISRGFAAQEAKAPLTSYEYEVGAPDPNGVIIEVSHCGICHSDLHLIDNDWQMSSFPFVPGHEIVGSVLETGSEVKGLRVGERVGVGWQSGACMECDPCIDGHENLCVGEGKGATCVGRNGGFASIVQADNRFAFPIPEALASENAAPLLCGGITVYSPLLEFDVRPNMKVGVIGIGGLGHLALQFCRAYGCEVTAFSTSPAKAAEAAEFGAHHFVNSRDEDELGRRAGSLDFILSTVFAELNWAAYLGLLKPRGTLCILGAVDKPLSIPAFGLIEGRKSISGSPIGSRNGIRKMLEFAARHDVQAKTQSFAMADVNTALDRLRENQVRYRAVLAN